jgi:hypothetical protein
MATAVVAQAASPGKPKKLLGKGKRSFTRARSGFQLLAFSEHDKNKRHDFFPALYRHG